MKRDSFFLSFWEGFYPPIRVNEVASQSLGEAIFNDDGAMTGMLGLFLCAVIFVSFILILLKSPDEKKRERGKTLVNSIALSLSVLYLALYFSFSIVSPQEARDFIGLEEKVLILEGLRVVGKIYALIFLSVIPMLFVLYCLYVFAPMQTSGMLYVLFGLRGGEFLESVFQYKGGGDSYFEEEEREEERRANAYRMNRSKGPYPGGGP